MAPSTRPTPLRPLGLALLASLAILLGWHGLWPAWGLGPLLLQRSGPLEHPRRRALFTYIRGNPGACFREVARQAGVATGTARHHLSVLKRHNVIVERHHNSTTRFFENHGKHDAAWKAIVLLREPSLRLLHGWIAGQPGRPQKEILEAMAQRHGWPRSSTQNRLHRLVEEGLVCLQFQGRHKVYWIVEEAGLPGGEG